METPKLTLIQTDEAVHFKLDNATTYEEAMQTLCSATLNVMDSFAKQDPKAKGDIYDAANLFFSSLLETFMPDKELRPDITADAIIETENRMIEERYSQLNRAQRREASQAFERFKRQQGKKVKESNENKTV